MSERPVPIPGEPKVDLEQARAHGLAPDEYRKIEQIIGRTPTYTELGVFSVMWSEHCSYKSSRRHLRKLPSKSELVVQGPGENAGAIDVGDGWAAVFKIESHNHPSFVEPYQGAATGVGGILRDIFTMGARPRGEHELAQVRLLRASPHALSARRRGRRNRRLRQLRGRADGRGRSDVRRGVQRQHPGQRVLPRAGPQGRDDEREGARRGQSGALRWLCNRTRRNSRSVDGVGGVRQAKRGQAPGGASRRSVHREIIDRGVPGSGQDRCDRRDPGHGRGGTHVVVERDAVAWRTRDRTRPRQGSAARSGTDAVRNSALRIAGANADRRGARARGGIAGGLREMGPARGGDRSR